MNHRAALIVLGSQRLPGKVLAPLHGAPLLEYCIARLRAADVGPVVVATTTNPEDAAVLALARRLGVGAYAGPVDDVLLRYAQVVRAHPDAAWVLRATGDNPLVDIDAPRRVLKALEAGADYAVEEALPLGAAVEGVRRDVLLNAQQEAATPYDREHVTPWVRQAAGLVRAMPLAPEAVRAPDLRFTVDTPEDLAYVSRLTALAATVGGDPRLMPLARLVALARTLPPREAA